MVRSVIGKIYYTTLCFLLPLFVISQVNLGGTENNLQTDMLFQDLNLDYRNIYMDSQKRQAGNSKPVTVYLHKDWNNRLFIRTINDRSMVLNASNYNVTSGKFEVQASKDSVFIMESSAIEELRFNNKKFVKVVGKKDSYEELFAGTNVIFFKGYGYRLKAAPVNPMTSKKLKEDEVVITQNFFIEIDGAIKNVDLKKKSILKALSNKKSEVSSYQNENKLNYKKVEDVIKILEYYDSL